MACCGVRVLSDAGMTEITLIGVFALGLLYAAYTLFFLANVGLAVLYPDLMRFEARRATPWRLKLPPFERRAEKLKALGFANIGTAVKTCGLVGVPVLVFYHREHDVYATIHSVMLLPFLHFMSRTPNGTVVNTAWLQEDWEGSSRLRYHSARGTPAMFFRQHLANVVSADPDPSRVGVAERGHAGQMIEVLELWEREKALRYGGVNDADDSDHRVPPSVSYVEELHHAFILVPGRGMPRWVAASMMMALVIAGIVAGPAAFAVIVAVVLAAGHIHRRRRPLHVWLSHGKIAARGFWPARTYCQLPLATTEAVVDGRDLVLVDRTGDGSTHFRFRGYGSEKELRWLLFTIESAREHGFLAEIDGGAEAEPPAHLATIMKHAAKGRQME